MAASENQTVNQVVYHLVTFRKILPVMCILLLLVVTPAAAKEEAYFYNTQDFTATATDTYMINSIRAENLPEGTIQQFVFDSYGDTYNLEIKSYPKDWGWWNFEITETYPDGTTETTILTKFAPISLDYDINVQSYFAFGYFIWDTNIYVTLTPLSVESEYQQVPEGAEGVGSAVSTYTPLAFSYVQGVSNYPMEKVTVYYITPAEYEQIQDGDFTLAFTSALGDLFDWTWDMVLATISKIPYVGDFFVTSAQIAAVFIEESFFWINLLFIQHWALFIMTLEFFIIGEAIYSTKTRVKLLSRVAENHVKILKFFMFVGEFAIMLTMKIIDTVAKIIETIKPI